MKRKAKKKQKNNNFLMEQTFYVGIVSEFITTTVKMKRKQKEKKN